MAGGAGVLEGTETSGFPSCRLPAARRQRRESQDSRSCWYTPDEGMGAGEEGGKVHRPGARRRRNHEDEEKREDKQQKRAADTRAGRSSEMHNIPTAPEQEHEDGQRSSAQARN
eukprot:768583-Hanusia_phi.AAC.3